jgi:hypothetical protein
MLVAVLALCTPLRAQALRLDAWQGHLSIGYGKVFSDSLAPSGSLSVAGGVDHPLTGRWRIGPVVSLSLLGSSRTVRGSVPAGIDYSMLDGALLLHYLPAKVPGSPARGPSCRWPAAAPGSATWPSTR